MSTHLLLVRTQSWAASNFEEANMFSLVFRRREDRYGAKIVFLSSCSQLCGLQITASLLSNLRIQLLPKSNGLAFQKLILICGGISKDNFHILFTL